MIFYLVVLSVVSLLNGAAGQITATSFPNSLMCSGNRTSSFTAEDNVCTPLSGGQSTRIHCDDAGIATGSTWATPNCTGIAWVNATAPGDGQSCIPFPSASGNSSTVITCPNKRPTSYVSTMAFNQQNCQGFNWGWQIKNVNNTCAIVNGPEDTVSAWVTCSTNGSDAVATLRVFSGGSCSSSNLSASATARGDGQTCFNLPNINASAIIDCSGIMGTTNNTSSSSGAGTGSGSSSSSSASTSASSSSSGQSVSSSSPGPIDKSPNSASSVQALTSIVFMALAAVALVL